MKKFLKYIGVWIVIMMFITVTPSVIAILAIRNADLKIPVQKHILVLGHSHAECAIDDNIFYTCFNYAHSNELEKMQFNKLKAFCEVNPQIDTVIIPLFTETSVCNPLSHELNNLVDNLYINKAIRFGDEQDWEYLLHKPFLYVQLATLAYKNISTMIRYLDGSGNDYSQIESGGYLYLERNKVDKNIDIMTGEEIVHNFIVPQYMKKMITYCQIKGLTLVLMEYPIFHQDRFFDIKRYEQFKRDSLKGIPIANYADFPLPYNAYGDIRHLNHIGARIFSNELRTNGIKTVIY